MRKKLFQYWGISTLFLFLSLSLFAQNKAVTGTVVDKDGAGVAGASVTVKGTNIGTNTSADGSFNVNAPASASTLVISYVGFAPQEVPIGAGPLKVTLLPATSNDLNEVVVVGYGTARKKDLTGAVASVTAKEFNTGQMNSPEQLLQGKVPGVQITNSSGQPGGITIVRIRGNNSIRSGNNPLYVIDGVPLDGRSPRPSFSSGSAGTQPGSDALVFLNPNEIQQIDILKDASASAIYGSRGANGVVLVTTKKGTVGPAKVDFATSVGVGGIMRKVDVLDANGYRAAIQKFGAPNTDSGSHIDPFGDITRNGLTQNYSVAISGGSDNGKYRASMFIGDQDGVILKANLKKYVGNINGQYKFLNKKLSVDFNASVANVIETAAPISQDAGSNGNLISLALIWNPTLELKRNGLYFQDNNSGQVNPIAYSDAYSDISNSTTLLGNISAGYKFTDWLEYRVLVGVNKGVSNRRAEIQGWLQKTGGNAPGNGEAGTFDNELLSRNITHTLNFVKDLSENLSLNAVAGYEYWKTDFGGRGAYVFGFNYNLSEADRVPIHYYDNMSDGKQANLQYTSFKDPTVEIQSYFARATLNYQDKYLLTATLRADGSNKFGKNNRYAYFPSVAAAWNIDHEGFMKDNNIFDAFKLRLGYGQTGNQEFPADASQEVYRYTAYGNRTFIHAANPDLKWETVRSYNAGIDFTVLNGRLYGSLDYFNKRTIDPVIQQPASQPQPPGGASIYANIDGAYVENKGVEVALGFDIIKKQDFTWNVGVNATFLKNKFVYPAAGKSPLILTGALHGQGTSGAFSEAIAHDQPINVFYLPIFSGFDKDGIGIYSVAPEYAGDPNPSSYVGLNMDFNYKKWTLSIAGHGAFGNYLYNNTLMSVLNISNIVGGRNIHESLVNSGESVSNPISTSTRFMEKGDYFKIHNATLKYTIGNIGKAIKNLDVYLMANNLFVITNYNGFDPEVNVDKALNGVPSLGIDYIGFPTQRTVLVGLNFSL
ncbi:MAG: SusC/RagA family TonB-linked outer membrane protein [Chitinophagaceae bacterium]|nr:SusC/RagA family TonB-linked outer membrane protein [Chitinophagaceae bacterium]